MDKKKVFLWSLYDFANSIPNVAFFLYFSQWLVVEQGVSDFWYNMIFLGSSLLLVLSTPIAGILADHISIRKPFILWSSLLQVFSLGVAAVIAMFAQSSGEVLCSAIAYLIGIYAYQFSLVFYDALLPDIAPPEQQGFASGVGQFANWFGQIVGIFAVAVFASGAWVLFGTPGRTQTLLPSVILMLVCALPLLIWYREKTVRRPKTLRLAREYRSIFKRFRELIKIPGVGRYLLAFFLFNDALLTSSNNFPIYLEQVFHVSDLFKSLLLVGILLTSALGGGFGGWIADKVGLKKTLLFILACWISIFPILAATTDIYWFSGFVIVMGFLYGATWAVCRAVMAALVPNEQLNHAFSYYALAERFSTFMSPLSWGVIVTVFAYAGPVRYQLAMLVLTIFIVIGYLIVRKIPLER
jgi:UMF1 family MFS transporter